MVQILLVTLNKVQSLGIKQVYCMQSNLIVYLSSLQQLLEMTNLSVHEVKKLLRPLVATFHLSPGNISFQPKQWRLITLILLKM